MNTRAKIAEHATNLLSLQGKVAIVTGGGSGIGRGISLLLAEMGAFVAVPDVNEETASDTIAEIKRKGSEGMALKCDVRKADDCRRAVADIIDKKSKIDILCNCAGIAIRKDVVTLTEEEWDLALDVTLKGIYLLSHEVVPHMIRAGGGSIINIGSGWSLKGGPKAALRGQRWSCESDSRDGH